MIDQIETHGEKSTLEVIIRQPEKQELKEIVALQTRIWSYEDATDAVPIQTIDALAKGGLAYCAYVKEPAQEGLGTKERLVGFVFGFYKKYKGEMVYYAHMVGVDYKFQRHDIATKLSLKIRDQVLGDGIKKAVFTYDPMMPGLSDFYITKLGGQIDVYETEQYGTSSSPLQSPPLHSDRFTAVVNLENDGFKKFAPDPKDKDSTPDPKDKNVNETDYSRLTGTTSMITAYKDLNTGFWMPSEVRESAREQIMLVPIPLYLHRLELKMQKAPEPQRTELERVFSSLTAEWIPKLRKILGNPSLFNEYKGTGYFCTPDKDLAYLVLEKR